MTEKGDIMVTENIENESRDPDSVLWEYYGKELESWRKAEKRWEEAFGTDDRVP